MKFIQRIQRIQSALTPKKTDHVVLYSTKALIQRYHEDNLAGLGGQLAYFFIISLFPFLMLVNIVLSALNYDSYMITQFLSKIVPANMLSIIEMYFEYISETQSAGIFTFGILITLMTASKAISALLSSLNKAFRCHRRLSLSKRLMSYVIVILLLVLIFASLVFLSVGSRIFAQITSFFGLSESWSMVWRIIRWAVPIAGMVLAITALYLIIPDKNFPRRYLFIGALFATFLWIGMGAVLSLYTNNIGNYSLVYGTLGAIMIMLMFLYWSGIVIVLGGELAHILATRTEESEACGPNASGDSGKED